MNNFFPYHMNSIDHPSQVREYMNDERTLKDSRLVCAVAADDNDPHGVAKAEHIALALNAHDYLVSALTGLLDSYALEIGLEIEEIVSGPGAIAKVALGKAGAA